MVIDSEGEFDCRYPDPGKRGSCLLSMKHRISIRGARTEKPGSK